MSATAYEPYGVAIFCDDIREEVGGKLTYIGCYHGGAMVVGAPFPTALPKFAIGVIYIEPATVPVVPLRLRITWPGDADNPEQVWEGELNHGPVKQLEGIAPPDEPDRIRRLVFNVMIAPLNLPKSGMLRVRVLRGAQVIKLGSLKVMSGTVSPDSQTATAPV